MPRYTKHPKDMYPMTEENFIKKMKTGHFVHVSHRAYAILLYYTGVRRVEALRALKEQFIVTDKKLYFDVGQRMKGGLKTPPLPMLRARPFVNELTSWIESRKEGKKVFPFGKSTAYNVIDRAFDKYPHYFRMTKITMLFRKGFTIDQVRSWSGHKVIDSLNAYVGFSNIEDMAEA